MKNYLFRFTLFIFLCTCVNDVYSSDRILRLINEDIYKIASVSMRRIHAIDTFKVFPEITSIISPKPIKIGNCDYHAEPLINTQSTYKFSYYKNWSHAKRDASSTLFYLAAFPFLSWLWVEESECARKGTVETPYGEFSIKSLKLGYGNLKTPGKWPTAQLERQEKLIERVNRLRNGKDIHTLIVKGKGGSGKTVSTREAARDISKPKLEFIRSNRPIVWYFSCETEAGFSSQLIDLVQDITQTPRNNWTVKNAKDTLEQILSIHPDGKNFICIYDDVKILNIEPDFLLKPKNTAGVNIITTREGQDEKFESYNSMCSEISMNPLTEEEAQGLYLWWRSEREHNTKISDVLKKAKEQEKKEAASVIKKISPAQRYPSDIVAAASVNVASLDEILSRDKNKRDVRLYAVSIQQACKDNAAFKSIIYPLSFVSNSNITPELIRVLYGNDSRDVTALVDQLCEKGILSSPVEGEYYFHELSQLAAQDAFRGDSNWTWTEMTFVPLVTGGVSASVGAGVGAGVGAVVGGPVGLAIGLKVGAATGGSLGYLFGIGNIATRNVEHTVLAQVGNKLIKQCSTSNSSDDTCRSFLSHIVTLRHHYKNSKLDTSQLDKLIQNLESK